MAKPFSKLQKKNYLEDGEGRLFSLSILRQKSLNLVVIPGLTRNPICLNWIPAFAGMTTLELMLRSVGRAMLALCSFVNESTEGRERSLS